MDIVQPLKEDQAHVTALLKSCMQHMRNNGIDQWNETYPNEQIVKEDLDSNALYIVKADGGILAVMTLDEQQPPEYGTVPWTVQSGKALVIHRLAVHPNHQGRGLAKLLVEFAERKAREGKYDSIRLDAYTGNPPALRLYEKFGYEARGEVWFPSRLKPFYCYEKSLQ